MSKSSDSDRIVQSAGSPLDGEPVFLVIGKIRRPHGLRGEQIMEIHTDFPERIVPGIRVFVGGDHQPMQIRSVRTHKDMLLVSFDGIDSPNDAGVFRNSLVYVRSDDRPALPEGDYYHHQLHDLQVVTESGEVLGTITEILSTGANDVLVVRPETGGDILIPLIDEVVLGVDLEAGTMQVHLIPGLL